MNKCTIRAAMCLGVALPMLWLPAMANGNVWADQPHGGYAPQGYVPHAPAQMSGYGMGMGFGAGGMIPAQGMSMHVAPPVANVYAPAPAPAPAYSAQPMWPVPPEHPAWPSGYPGIAPGAAPAPPVMSGGVPWPMR